MPKDMKIAERRALESWRARACAAGMSVGAQVFLFGTGIAMPLALNSAWIAALAALPVSALVTAMCRKKTKKKRKPSRTACVLLAVTLLGNCVFAVAALVNFAEQTLLELSPVLWSIAVTVLSVFAGVVFLGEPFSWLSLLASAVIIAGVYGVQK